MNSPSPKPAASAATAAQALLVSGLAWGLADAALAARGFRWDGALDAPLCAAGAVFVCTLVLAPVLLGAALVPRLRSFACLLGLGLALALFVEAYWWSRPWVFPGRSATSPERLAASAGIALAALGAGLALG
ncbi:MAG: hypothetical protein FJ299_02660, partial [Planctomycetes bacterium]|nr:hypothetical protein [Planctomycetota bacterium]